MQALSFKNNSYMRDVDFRPLKQKAHPHLTPHTSYSRQADFQSLSETDHLSSFQSADDLIDSLFVVGGSDVYRYVQQHPELLSLLLRSRAEAYWLFGPVARVAVRVEHDPEGEFEARLLVAIQTALSATLALHLIDVLDDRWWLSVSAEARALMKIDVEYV